jgi:hypothetical protein
MEEAGRNRRPARGVPVAPKRQAPPGHSVHPDNHLCSPWDIRYDDPNPGDAQCDVCGRRWSLYKERGSLRRRVVPFTRRMPSVEDEDLAEGGHAGLGDG